MNFVGHVVAKLRSVVIEVYDLTFTSQLVDQIKNYDFSAISKKKKKIFQRFEHLY